MVKILNRETTQDGKINKVQLCGVQEVKEEAYGLSHGEITRRTTETFTTLVMYCY